MTLGSILGDYLSAQSPFDLWIKGDTMLSTAA